MREAVHATRLEPGTAYIFVLSRGVLDAEFTTLVAWVEQAIEANRMKLSRKQS